MALVPYEKIKLEAGDVLSCVSDQGLRMGIFIRDDRVIYAKKIDKTYFRIVCECLYDFSSSNHISVDRYYMKQVKYLGGNRVERSMKMMGKIWGSKLDLNPQESFIEYVCNGKNPPNATSVYSYTVSGSLVGFYLGGPIGLALCAAAGYTLDSYLH